MLCKLLLQYIMHISYSRVGMIVSILVVNRLSYLRTSKHVCFDNKHFIFILKYRSIIQLLKIYHVSHTATYVTLSRYFKLYKRLLSCLNTKLDV